MTLRVGWYTTARGAGSRGMFEAVRDAIRAGTLDARFAFVFCNREPGEDATTDAFFDLVRAEAIPLVTLSSVRFRKEHGGSRSRPGEPLPEWREAYDAEVARLVDVHGAGIGVLAGYMLIFTAPFVRTHRLLNLHPALPGGPTGTWREVIRELIRTGARESGVMAHLAIPEVDLGPVAAFCRYPIEAAPIARGVSDDELEASPLFASIRAAGLRREAAFLVAALQAEAEGRHGLGGPLDLTAEVEARLRATPST
ncbi:MAG: phosphoglycerate transporter [Dehalococcoidia bacterium]|nr:MAG: phosphoglycerate transporter [Dehalococcoidia bacterium]